jgi:putative phage-type endonuclease
MATIETYTPTAPLYAMMQSVDTTALLQGSDDWFASRVGKITASNVGAILGLSPFKKPADVMRAMVREKHFALSEFSGNVATEYGAMNEHLACADYQFRTGNKATTTGLHLYENWLGASPDGIIEDGIVEFKCPYSLRDGGEFKSIFYQEHYYAQIQIQMFVTKTKFCDFVQWHKNDMMIERIVYDEKFIELVLPKLRAFYDEFVEECKVGNREKHLESRHKTVNSQSVQSLTNRYLKMKAEIKSLNEIADKLLIEIVKDCGNKESEIGTHKLTLVKRKSISYAKAIKELLPEADLSDYESVSEFWTLK